MRITKEELRQMAILARRRGDRVAAIGMGRRNSTHKDKRNQGTRAQQQRKAIDSG